VRETRKNQPVAIIRNVDPEQMFAKPEPTINKLQIDKTGNVGIKFSKEMVFPDNWKAMHEQYLQKQRLRNLEGNNTQPFLVI
jgi:hypothetical protein